MTRKVLPATRSNLERSALPMATAVAESDARSVYGVATSIRGALALAGPRPRLIGICAAREPTLAPTRASIGTVLRSSDIFIPPEQFKRDDRVTPPGVD